MMNSTPGTSADVRKQAINRYSFGLLFLGLMVHAGLIGVVIWRTGQVDGYALRSLDSTEYMALARNLAQHGVFSQDEAAPRRPDTWRTPGYPVFLAVWIRLLGPQWASPSALVIIQQVLSVVNVLLLFRIALSMTTPRRSFLAALLFLLEPYHLLYSAWIMATTLLTTMILLTWRAWLVATQRLSRRVSAWLGCVAGMTVLVAPIAILIPMVVVTGFVFFWWRKSVHAGRTDASRSQLSSKPRISGWNLAACSFVVLASASLMMGGWAVRNRLVAGHAALSHQSGIVLAYFKAAEVQLWREGRTADRYVETSLDPAMAELPHQIWDHIDEQLKDRFGSNDPQVRSSLTWRNLAQGNRTAFDSFQISRSLSAIAVEMLLQSPWSTLVCCGTRAAMLLMFPLDLAISPPKGVAVSRMKSAVVGTFYMMLSVAVLWKLVSRRSAWLDAFFPVTATIALLLTTTPQLDPRFRVPMIPLLLFLALARSAKSETNPNSG